VGLDRGVKVVGPLFRCGSEYGFAGITKVMLAHEGVLDDPEVRPPLELPDPEERESIVSALDRVDDRLPVDGGVD